MFRSMWDKWILDHIVHGLSIGYGNEMGDLSHGFNSVGGGEGREGRKETAKREDWK